MLDLTRILAGPVGTRALAAHGADVLLVNAPQLPNIEALAETSRGKLSAHADLRQTAGREVFERVLRDAHVFVQGYRPGGLEQLGYGAEALAAATPGHRRRVAVGLWHAAARGRPAAASIRWCRRPAASTTPKPRLSAAAPPRALPVQFLDHASGYLIALGAAAALWRQQHEGGSWHVQVSLARTGLWLRGLGRVQDGFAAPQARLRALSRHRPQRFR